MPRGPGRHVLLEQRQFGTQSLGPDLTVTVRWFQEGGVQREAVDMARHELGQRLAGGPAVATCAVPTKPIRQRGEVPTLLGARLFCVGGAPLQIEQQVAAHQR
jgi:hypothetical protein